MSHGVLQLLSSFSDPSTFKTELLITKRCQCVNDKIILLAFLFRQLDAKKNNECHVRVDRQTKARCNLHKSYLAAYF